MKKNILNLLILFSIIITMTFSTGCGDNEETISEENTSNENVAVVTEELPYSWIIEPTIEADNIIDLGINGVSIIEQDGKYNFISQDGEELLDEYYDAYWANSDDNVTELYVWNEDGSPMKVEDDFTLEEDEYWVLGGFISYDIYYNTTDDEFFTVGYEYYTYDQPTSTELSNYLSIHNTYLTPFISADVESTNIEDLSFDLEKYGYFDPENLSIEFEAIYDYALPFYNSVAAVEKDGTAGYIDTDGEELFDFCFEKTRSFDNDKAWVMQDGKWGLIELI